MKKNISEKEVGLRIGGAMVLIVLALFVVPTAALQILLAIAAAVLAFSAFTRVCPIYHLMKKSTCEVSSHNEAHAGTPAPASEKGAE